MSDMLTFYDAFHGIGGFRYGLEQAGMKCVGGCEINENACLAYGVINGEQCEPTDVRTIDAIRLRGIDCFVFGWPCTDNSIAGKRDGQREGTRSGLLYIATEKLRSGRFPYFIAENVTGLFSVNNGRDFYATIREFANVGYDVQWQVLNTRWFLPQDRPRIIFVGHLRGQRRPEIFPIIADGRVFIESRGQERSISPCIRAKQGGADIEEIYIIEPNRGIRRTTPLERFRLQGYPDEWFHKCKEAGISDTNLYMMAGNGVSSPVAKEVGSRLMASCG